MKLSTVQNRTARRRGAFTLVEMLVVVSIIVLLVGILTPSFGLIRERMKRFVCASNMRQLGIAWKAYAVANSGNLVGSNTYRDFDWVHPSGDMKTGALYPHSGRPELYKCTNPANPGYPISYSMPGTLSGQVDWRFVPAGADLPWLKYQRIPNPSATLVLIEEDDWRGFNKGSWMLASENQWIDYVAGNHEGGDNLVFADEHVEYWYWKDENTLNLPYHDYSFYMPDPGNPDLARLWAVYWPK